MRVRDQVHLRDDLHHVVQVISHAKVLMKVHVQGHPLDDLQRSVQVISQIVVLVMLHDRLHRQVDHQSIVLVIGLRNKFFLGAVGRSVTNHHAVQRMGHNIIDVCNMLSVR